MPEENKAVENAGCVLLIDDDEAVRVTTSMRLKTFGFTVLLADCYNNAIKILNENTEIEAIICDMKMPGGSGLDVLQYVKEHKKNIIPLIFLTGYGSLESCQEAIRGGAFDYILRPVEHNDQLIHPLQHAIEKFRLAKRNMQMRWDLMQFSEDLQLIIREILTSTEQKEEIKALIAKILNKWK